jgi:hypothetical protein
LGPSRWLSTAPEELDEDTAEGSQPDQDDFTELGEQQANRAEQPQLLDGQATVLMKKRDQQAVARASTATAEFPDIFNLPRSLMVIVGTSL